MTPSKINSPRNNTIRLAIGTAQFGQKYGVANSGDRVPIEVASQIIAFAGQAGIDTVDTAISYGDSERRLGKIGMQGFNIISKLPPIPDGHKNISQWVYTSVISSLKSLQINKLSAILLHRPSDLMESTGQVLWSSLQNLKQDGLVDKIGISVYDTVELDGLYHRYQIDVVQAPLNILDRRFSSSGWITRLQENGTEFHARSVFLQGLLLMSATNRPRYFQKWASLWRKWDRWLQDMRLTALEVCLSYICSFSGVKKIVVGIDNLEQLHSIIISTEGISTAWPDAIFCSDEKLIDPRKWPN